MFEMDYSYGTTETNFPHGYYPFSDCQSGKAVNQNKKREKGRCYKGVLFLAGNLGSSKILII